VRHYGIPKSKTFPWSRTGFANAMNTGLFYVTGSHALFVHDYTKLSGNGLFLWNEVAKTQGNSLIHGVAITYETEPPTGEDNDIFTNLPDLWQPREPWVPEKFELGYWQAPIEFFEQTNGIDERADFCSEWALNSVNHQAKLYDYTTQINRAMVCHMIDHRRWHKNEDGNITQEGTYVTRGQFADIPVEPEWSWWSANPYNFKVLRDSLKGK
jgi:hypothetical protein